MCFSTTFQCIIKQWGKEASFDQRAFWVFTDWLYWALEEEKHTGHRSNQDFGWREIEARNRDWKDFRVFQFKRYLPAIRWEFGDGGFCDMQRLEWKPSSKVSQFVKVGKRWENSVNIPKKGTCEWIERKQREGVGSAWEDACCIFLWMS